jgi:hypothetical protein
MGGVVNDHLQRMRDIDAELAGAGDDLAGVRSELAKAVEALAGATEWIMTNGLADPKQALAGATPYLRMFGIVTGGWLMARQALAARADISAGIGDAERLEGKVTTARFFGEQILPTAAGLVAQIQGGASVLYDITPEALTSV